MHQNVRSSVCFWAVRFWILSTFFLLIIFCFLYFLPWACIAFIIGGGWRCKNRFSSFHFEKCTTCFLYFKINRGHLSRPTDRNQSLLYDRCPCSRVWRDHTYSTIPPVTVKGMGCHPCDHLTAHGKADGVSLPRLHYAVRTVLLPDSLWTLGFLTVFEEANGRESHSHKGINSTNSLRECGSWFFSSLTPWFQVRPQPQLVPWSQPGEILKQRPAKPCLVSWPTATVRWWMWIVFLSIVDLQYYISFRCTALWFSIFTDYTPLKVITS